MLVHLLSAHIGSERITEPKSTARAFKQEFSASVDKMPSQTWMYKVMDWVATKDMVSLAGLDNTDGAGKQAMVETAVLAEKVMYALGDANKRVEVVEMRAEMEVCKNVL